MQKGSFCKTVSVAGGILSPQFPAAVTALISATLSLRTSQLSNQRERRMVWRLIVSIYEMNRRVTNKNKRDNL